MSKHSRSEQVQKIEEYGNISHLVFYACILFIVIMFARTLSFWSNDNHEMPSITALFKSPTNCSAFNDNFKACVDAENSGQGCAWYSGCQLCTKKGSITPEGYENMCFEKSKPK